MSYTENAKVLKAQIDANKETVNTVEKLGGIEAINESLVVSNIVEQAGGMTTERISPSDKVGSDWLVYSINGAEFYREYVPTDNEGLKGTGTKDDPYVWKDGMQLTQNAYYTYNDERKVWFGTQNSVATSWDDEDLISF